MRLRLAHLPGVHRPVSDTRLLLAALSTESLTGCALADVCSGSGVLAVAAARLGARPVLAVDVSRRALLAARLNARLNACSIRTRRGDLLAGLHGQRFDHIVCNPPYVPATTDALPRHRRATALDGGRDGRALLDRVCREAPRHLRPGGALWLVHSSVCDIDATCALLDRCGLVAQVVRGEHGPLGPVLAARAPMLRARGLLGDEDEEQIAVIRARAAHVPGATSELG